MTKPCEWLLTENSSLQDTLVLPSIQCRLPLSEIYLKVRFAPEDGEPEMRNDGALKNEGTTKHE